MDDEMESLMALQSSDLMLHFGTGDGNSDGR